VVPNEFARKYVESSPSRRSALKFEPDPLSVEVETARVLPVHVRPDPAVMRVEGV
jgi:hypothetical protein